MPPYYSAHGGEIDHLIIDIHVMMVVLFVFWGGYFAYALFRFRGRRSQRASYEGMRSQWPLYSVAVVMILEFIHLFGFSVPAWAKWAKPYPHDGSALEVSIIAEQFAWNVQYPGADGIFGRRDVKLVSQENPLGLDPNDPHGRDDVIALNELHLEVNRPVLIHITSKDVIHSFKLPVMRAEQDAIPGMDVPIHFTPTRTSNDELWEIACAQLCGLGHYRMRGQLVVETKADLDKWLAANIVQPPSQ
jgi:cytochrome c oxidase subunit 2